MKLKIYAIAAILLATVLISGCAPRYTCDDIKTKYNCKGLTAERCNTDSYVIWAKKNCGLGTKTNPIAL